jgi:hypothetical protein
MPYLNLHEQRRALERVPVADLSAQNSDNDFINTDNRKGRDF